MTTHLHLMHEEVPASLARLVRNLARYAGRNPGGYEAVILQNGSIRMRGPCGAAFYPAQGWMSKFTRHLYLGYFEPPAAPPGGGRASPQRVASGAQPQAGHAPQAGR